MKDFVEFLLRAGDLESGEFGGINRARAGIEGHRRVRRGRPEGYRAEVPVRRRFEADGVAWELGGRIDGLMEADGRTILEEIKTTRQAFDLLSVEDPLHWAQAKVYGHLLATETGLEEIDVQLTYLHLDTGEVRSTRQRHTATALSAFFEPLRRRYTAWIRRMAEWRRSRDGSIATLEFPFDAWRPGQRELSGAVRAAIDAGARLFAEAPTGIGKTASILWPALRALGEGACRNVFFLTARTPGRLIAEETVARFRSRGLRLKSLTLTARDRICFTEEGRCDPATCPFAKGFFDRLERARDEAFDADIWNRESIEALARRHQLCPFALQFELLPWADFTICDYNYAFDPQVALDHLSGPDAGASVLLVDEAHNLLDRARDMFSAEVREHDFAALIADLPPRLRALRSASARVREGIAGAAGTGAPRAVDAAPADLLAALEAFVREADAQLVRNRPEPFRDELLECYFEALSFLRTAEEDGGCHRTLLTREGGGARVRLFCVDPAPRLRETWKRCRAAVLFSATLTPLPFFRDALGGTPEEPLLQLPSPFPPQHLGLFVAGHVPTEYRNRAGSIGEVAGLMSEAVSARPGAYLAYFPSYEYLRSVRAAFMALRPDIASPAQEPGMPDEQRTRFLEGLTGADITQVAFAVLGGIFAEGIDLPGGALAGIFVVGVGLPQVCLERDEIRGRFDAAGADGFAIAYAYPGFNRVLQAAGRLIRSADDAGVVVLIDRRFVRADYRSLYPGHWQHARIVRSRQELREATGAFRAKP